MADSIEIIPGILTDNPTELRQMIEKAQGVVQRVQIDIIDGVFSDNKTVDPSALNDVDNDLLLDFHLMVNEPINWVEKCVRAGADRIIGQVEMMNSATEFIRQVQDAGVKVGVALDLDTSVNAVEKRLLNDMDVVLVMSVPAGFGGQKFHKEALEKIKKLDEIRKKDRSPFRICDDGGVTLEYVDDLARAAADEAIVGNRIFEGNLAENIHKYESAA